MKYIDISNHAEVLEYYHRGNQILEDMDIQMEDRVRTVSAIVNHDESTGVAAEPVAAALIIADKCDVRAGSGSAGGDILSGCERPACAVTVGCPSRRVCSPFGHFPPNALTAVHELATIN